MKKKGIEKIPFAPAQSNTVVAFVQAIKGEDHLFVEATAEAVPWIRMVFTKGDWGLFYPASNTWSAAGLDEEKHKFRGTIMAPESEKAIKDFCDVKYATWMHPTWIQSLTDLIKNIRWAREEKRNVLRKARLELRGQNTPPLPGDLENWINNSLLTEHFLYYKRHGRYADIACSRCGRVTTARIKSNDYDPWGCEKLITPPKHGERGMCQHCKMVGTYKAQGKTKGVYKISKKCFVGQAYKEQGAVIRYIEVEKIYRLDTVLQDQQEIMISAKERVIITEIARTYLEPHKEPQTDYHKYSNYSGDFWDDHNLSGMNKISIAAARVYPGTYRSLKSTFLKWSAAEEYAKHDAVYNLKDYMIQYIQLPQLEMIVKMKLYGVADAALRYDHSAINRYAEKVEDFLMIRKERIKDLISVQGCINYLKAWQFEKEQGIRLTRKEAIFIAESRVRAADVATILQYTTMAKLVNKIERYAGIDIPETANQMCTTASACLMQITTLYMDYINMRLQRGYDLHNQIFLFPRDLQAAHDQMVLETTQQKIEDRSKEVDEKYPHIKEKYRTLRKKYFYEDEDYQIRPARSASEIVAEGQILHHCVGGDNYLSKHDKGESTILFMRPRKKTEMPYITIEIQGDWIKQWYGIRDTKPNKTIIDDHLRKYIASMKGEEQNGISAVKHG